MRFHFNRIWVKKYLDNYFFSPLRYEYPLYKVEKKENIQWIKEKQ